MNSYITGKIVRKVLSIVTFLLASYFAHATHEVGGYISLKCMGGTTYSVTITTYTNTYGTLADRDTMRIYWGDGTNELLYRVNGLSNYLIPGDNFPNGEPLCNYDLSQTPPSALPDARKLNLYTGIHTYPGPGNYTLATDDADRMAQVNNINNSVNIDFFLYNTLSISPFVGCVNSPVVTNAPVCLYGCVDQCFTYNPGAYIPTPPSDGDDSISYSLGSSLQWYREVCDFSTEGATVNDTTGTLTWCGTKSGKWNFVITMVTWRRTIFDGEKLIIPSDTTELELEVIIDSDCHPPIVTTTNTCVVAGNTVSLNFHATSSSHYSLYITDAGEPFSLSPPATLTNIAPATTVSPLFRWATTCTEVRENPYEVQIEATEKVPILVGFSTDTVYYRGYGTSFIRVIGPPPPNLKATVEGTEVCLSWGESPCPQATGYNIYRGVGCIHYKPDLCTTGVPASTGYQLIATNVGIGNTTYCDSNGGIGLSPGVAYSYIVDATYPLPDGSQSIASNDTCVSINLSVPFITNVSVTQTSTSNGEMFIRWMKPLTDSIGIDTNKFKPPYQYILERASNMHSLNFKEIKTVITPVFNLKGIDTTYTDTGLNTQDSSYNYKIDFYYTDSVTGKPKYAGSSGTASSIFLRLQREDQSMNLGWTADVPWSNDTFFVYRQNPAVSPVYNLVGKVVGHTTYTDTGLHNGSQYCYYVKSSSHYADNSILHPLYDSSETICGTPYDTIAPCSPPLYVAAKCTLYEDSIVWSNPNRLCPRANKVWSYQIWYTPVENGAMTTIATINALTNPDDTVFVNSNMTSVAGCYAVVAYDSAGQASPLNTFCVDNCPIYILPNVFTPGGSVNGLFTPLEPFRYVESIDINIFNRWGQLMFHTTDPYINWNGKVDNSGGECPDGVYYYICTVNEIRLTGIVPITLKGFVQIVREGLQH